MCIASVIFLLINHGLVGCLSCLTDVGILFDWHSGNEYHESWNVVWTVLVNVTFYYLILFVYCLQLSLAMEVLLLKDEPGKIY